MGDVMYLKGVWSTFRMTSNINGNKKRSLE